MGVAAYNELGSPTSVFTQENGNLVEAFSQLRFQNDSMCQVDIKLTAHMEVVFSLALT